MVLTLNLTSDEVLALQAQTDAYNAQQHARPDGDWCDFTPEDFLMWQIQTRFLDTWVGQERDTRMAALIARVQQNPDLVDSFLAARGMAEPIS